MNQRKCKECIQTTLEKCTLNLRNWILFFVLAYSKSLLWSQSTFRRGKHYHIWRLDFVESMLLHNSKLHQEFYLCISFELLQSSTFKQSIGLLEKRSLKPSFRSIWRAGWCERPVRICRNTGCKIFWE